MNKRITKKLMAAFAVATLFAAGTFGQGIPNADYSLYNPAAAAPANIDYVTVGAEMGYYADPDPLYHPNYAATSALTADFTWDWQFPVNPGTGASITGGGTPANYVEITYAATGVYQVSVAETAPAAFGGCADATPRLMDVTVVAVPTGTMSVAPGGAWQAINANRDYQICSDQVAQTVSIAFVENVPNALASYSFQITETIENLNGAGAVTATPQAEAVIQNFALNNKVRTGNVGGLTAAAFNAATPNFTFTFSSDALTVQNAARTRYTYAVTRAGDALPSVNADFVSNITHKSNYLGAFASYNNNFTVASVSFIINPAPVTGPIYHISNTFRY